MARFRAFFKRLQENRNFNLFRLITALGFIAAAVLVLVTPLQLPDPDDWANYVGVQNFSHGKFTVDGFTLYQQGIKVGQGAAGSSSICRWRRTSSRWKRRPASSFISSLFIWPIFRAR